MDYKTNMIDQFFGKTFWISLAVLFATIVISIFSYFFGGALFFLPITICVVAFLSAKDPKLGLCAVFLELFSNPHGQLLSSQIFSFGFSLRMAVFVGFFLGYAIFLIKNKKHYTSSWMYNVFAFPWLILIIAVAVGFVRGLAVNNPSDVFSDGNAYFFILYLLPILSLKWDSASKQRLLNVLAAGTVFNIFVSFFILYLFTHFSDAFVRSSYIYFRDVRLAEITKLGETFLYRVFIQTQFFTFVFGALLLSLIPKLLSKKEKNIATLLLSFIFATFLLSLSRSFWVGMIVALIVFIFLFCKFVIKKHQIKSYLLSIISSFLIGFALILITVLFPIPAQKVGGSDLSDLFSKRITEEDVAISSRWNLLNPMINSIKQNPILGNGFGEKVEFQTKDPRALEINPNGVWSTYAMEWGWLELWLKMGILGPIGFLAIFFYMIKHLFFSIRTEQNWLSLGLLTGLLFLYTTHAFSPYLNHPIGLGFLLFIMTQTHSKSNLAVQQEKPVLTSAVSLQAEV